MNLIIFDDSRRNRLQPLTLTRPVGAIRIGILTIKEKWENYFPSPVSFFTEDYLKTKFPTQIAEDNLFIAGSVLPNEKLCNELKQLEINDALFENDELIAIRLSKEGALNFPKITIKRTKKFKNVSKINFLWNIFQKNEDELRKDFNLLTKNRKSAFLSTSNQLIGRKKDIFIEAGAKIEGSILNSNTGPIYIGKGAEIMEGSLIRGPFALGEHSQIKMGAKIYGATTVGPYCKVGGEVNNVVIFGYSNKAHDGFLGNSVVGEWCNLGADSNSSNLKNNYDFVKIFDFASQKLTNTETSFCGLFMGDYSKCGINSMFNSGTVIGVACNLFGTNYMRNLINSFSYGGPQHGYDVNQLEKVIETAQIVYKRRGKTLTVIEKEILEYLFTLSHPSFSSEKKK